MDLEKFYRRINKKIIEDFIKNKQEEHLNLEFKTVSKADFSDKNDRKNFARSLAGFANSNGGIIVWGVKAKKFNGIDCAYDTKEIQSLPQFVSRLNELTGELVKPIMEGIRHKRIPPKADKGFAVTLVPESDAGPHQAMRHEGRYYKRSGDSFYQMEHYDIEDMFGRRKKPKLSLYLDIKRGGSISGPQPTRYECKVFVGIENKGRGIAKNAALAIEVNEPYHIGKLSEHTSERHDFLRLSRPGSKKTIFSLGADVVIHSNSSLVVTIIAFAISETQQTIADLVVETELMAEDMRTVEERKVISGDDIRSKIIP